MADLYEDFMKYGEVDNREDIRLKDNKVEVIEECVVDNSRVRLPKDEDTLASIRPLKL